MLVCTVWPGCGIAELRRPASTMQRHRLFRPPCSARPRRRPNRHIQSLTALFHQPIRPVLHIRTAHYFLVQSTISIYRPSWPDIFLNASHIHRQLLSARPERAVLKASTAGIASMPRPVGMTGQNASRRPTWARFGQAKKTTPARRETRSDLFCRGSGHFTDPFQPLSLSYNTT